MAKEQAEIHKEGIEGKSANAVLRGPEDPATGGGECPAATTVVDLSLDKKMFYEVIKVIRKKL
jgi:hypothetical protein